MILEAAIIKITRNLDLIHQKDGQNISSHEKIKGEGLACLLSLLEQAPYSEYEKLLISEDYEVLIGYLLNVLCKISSNDKSKSIKQLSLDIILTLLEKLESLHCNNKSGKCSINLIFYALPGVSSALFRLIMSDTKLPKKLLVIAIKILTKFIALAFQSCKHTSNKFNCGQSKESIFTDTCENLAVRLSFLFDYVLNHSSELANEVKYEMLNFCEAVACRTKPELLSRSLRSLVKYTAFISSTNYRPNILTAEAQLRILIIVDNIKSQIQDCDSDDGRLDSVVITCLINLLDNLENNYLSMLVTERESELAVLMGLLRLLPRDNLTIFFEIPERREQFFKILTLLTEFSTDQPFLFLTDVKVDEDALETCDEKIYTVEKRFSHLNEKELYLLSSCCAIIGQDLDWLCLNDILKNDLYKYANVSNLFITHLILKGCLSRTEVNFKFTRQAIECSIGQIHENYIELNEYLANESLSSCKDVLKIVISIEIVVTLVELHVKSVRSKAERTIILKTLLCPLLSWSSSYSRAISEAALSALTQICHLYKFDSTKSLIEANIDYIVDGVMLMLDNFTLNHEVTNVLAITFKLSSLNTFYFFQDVYEKVFKLLAVYHYTEKSQSIALLFYRTISILSQWKESNDEAEVIPLKDESNVKSIIWDLDIERRVKKLENDIVETTKLKQRRDEMQVTEEDHGKTLEEIQSGNIHAKVSEQEDECQQEDQSSEKMKERPKDIILTEKILKHCINLLSSNYLETKILALKTATCGFKVLCDDENTLLPLVHQLWAPLVSRLTGDYNQNLEVNLCAFECLVSMAVHAKDFIKGRTLDTIIPRLCLFLESQARCSKGKKEYGPYCMTLAYKCQLKILTNLGALAYHIQLAYRSLWRVIRTSLIYLNSGQVDSLRKAARTSLHYLIALDADCVWYFAKQSNQLKELPFEQIYEVQ